MPTSQLVLDGDLYQESADPMEPRERVVYELDDEDEEEGGAQVGINCLSGVFLKNYRICRIRPPNLAVGHLVSSPLMRMRRNMRFAFPRVLVYSDFFPGARVVCL